MILVRQLKLFAPKKYPPPPTANKPNNVKVASTVANEDAFGGAATGGGRFSAALSSSLVEVFGAEEAFSAAPSVFTSLGSAVPVPVPVPVHSLIQI